MPFPVTERTVYNKNPLIEVICQLRFPPILRIDNEIPTLFQDTIRSKYPAYHLQTAVVQEAEIGSKELNNPWIRQTTTKEHKFSSEDNNWHVVIARTFIAFSTQEYVRWEDFIERLGFVFDVFNEIYQPSYFSRVGLRYIDVIDRAKLNLDKVEWSELLEPHVLGLLSTPECKSIMNFDNRYELELSDHESIAALKTSFAFNSQSDLQDSCFLIDTDFFNTKKTLIKDVFVKLSFLHERASRLIRWVIKPRLHEAMEPKEIIL